MQQAKMLWMFVGGILLTLSSGITQAMDATFIPRLEVGVESYDLKIGGLFQVDSSGSVLSTSDFDFSDLMPVVSGGLTVAIDRFYVDFSGQESYSGEDNWSRSVIDTSAAAPLVNVNGDVDFDRTEYAVALGYMVTDKLSIFVGYRHSKVDGDFDSTASAPQFGDVGAVKIKTEFEEDGGFLGASYGWHINTSSVSGVLSGSIAVASLDGDLDAKVKQVTGLLGVEDIPNDSSEGDTLGMKVGLTWKGFTSVSDLTYTVGVNGYKYEFDADGDDPDITETVVNFKIGLAYVF